MARIVVLGAGISGHTAAMILRRQLGPPHEVTVVSPRADYNWIPSNIWVGVGRMRPDQVEIPLRPVYDACGIRFVQAAATRLFPEGDGTDGPFVEARRTDDAGQGAIVRVPYDYLVNATGPKLRFDKTPGLGPDDGYSASVCTSSHAADAARRLQTSIDRMKRGERQRIVIGTGHGTCTCEGAAFEYTFNVEHELRRAGVRDRAEVVYLTNEAALGDFGVDGLVIRRGGYLTPSSTFAGSLFAERGVKPILGAHVSEVGERTIAYETLDGGEHTIDADMAMLLPPFTGVGLEAVGKDGRDLTATLFAPNGFMKVDADYTPRPYEAWTPSDWPRTYQNPTFRNLFAVGIAFAPPHAISRPRTAPSGTVIAPAPPRTGMPSATMARAVALSIADMAEGRAGSPTHAVSMAEMGAACVASAGSGLIGGSAVAMTMYPIIPDYDRYPGAGRDTRLTFGEVGVAGHWIKLLLHHMFVYKAAARPGWWLIPE